jgi:hypothetical protein
VSDLLYPPTATCKSQTVNCNRLTSKLLIFLCFSDGTLALLESLVALYGAANSEEYFMLQMLVKISDKMHLKVSLLRAAGTAVRPSRFVFPGPTLK